MAHNLTLIFSTILVASSFVQGQSIKRGLFPRALGRDMDICFGNDWQNDVTARFTGIFFGDFYTGGGTDILGGLAVEGNFHAPNYVVNANHGADCSAVNSLNSYGLVVGGITNTLDTHVHGNAYLNHGGTVDQVKEQNEGCFVTADAGTGIFDFKTVQEMAILSNEDFALLEPTAQLEHDGTMTYFRGTDLLLYEVLDFHSCNGRVCGYHTLKESDPNAIFFGEGNWNGVQGSTIDPLKTYVLNLPVLNGDTITIDSNNPSLGFNPCKLIYNFYPVDPHGHYMPTGEFTLLRKTANQLGGFTLAPRGHIIDGSVGNFAGNIIGLDYTWENLDAGVEIHDYRAAGGDCDYYLGCIPVHITSTPTAGPTTGTPSTYTSSGSTQKTITWTHPIFSFSTLNTCTPDYTTTETDTVTATATDTITETAAGTTATVTETMAEHTVTETSSFTETDIITTTLVIIKPTIYVRTVTATVTASDCSTSCTPDHTVTETDQTETVTSTETIVDTSECESHKHHHTSKDHSGHHHGPDEECDEEDEDEDEDDEDEDDKDEEDDEEDHKHKHNKNYNDDEDDKE